MVFGTREKILDLFQKLRKRLVILGRVARATQKQRHKTWWRKWLNEVADCTYVQWDIPIYRPWMENHPKMLKTVFVSSTFLNMFTNKFELAQHSTYLRSCSSANSHPKSSDSWAWSNSLNWASGVLESYFIPRAFYIRDKE